jgi:hypothetical protein
MRRLVLIFAIAALSGCGVETATTAATGAAIKKKEIEEGKNTQERARQAVDSSLKQGEQRASEGAER